MVLNSLNGKDIPKTDFIEQLEDLIFILNNKMEIDYLNENSLLKRLGYVKDDVLNQLLLKLSHPSDVGNIELQFKQILKKGNGSLEMRIRTKKGLYNWYHINGNTFIDENKKKKVILILRDITKYKTKEKEYQEIEERLNAAPELRFWKFLYPQKLMTAVEKSREMLVSVIDNIPQLIYWRDAELNFIGCNKNYALINGLEDPIQIIGKKDKDLLWSKYKFEKIKSAEQDVIKNNRPEYNIIEDWILLNGRKVWYNINRIPLSNSERKVIGILSTYEDITERFILEQKIKDSERKYRELYEKLKTGYFESDLEGNLRFFNNSFCEILGYSRSDLADKHFSLFVDNQTKHELIGIFNKIFKTGIGQSDFIHQIRRKDGKEIIVEISVYLRYNSNGEKVGFNGLLRNITDKYILEQKLKESEEKYRNLINNISDLIVELDLDGNFSYLSPQCYNIFGFYPENLIGKNAYTFLHPEDLQLLKKEIETKNKEGDIISIEFRTRNKDGYYIPIYVKASLVKIDDSLKFIGVARDITEKKIAEQKLKESEENYRLITENVNDLICVLNENVRYEYLNEDPHYRILGYKKEDLLGKSIVSFVHPDDKDMGVKKIRTGGPKASGEFRVRHKNGYYLWVEVRAKTFYNKDHKLKVIFISRDITERKKAEEKIRKWDEELKKLNKELEEKVLERTKELQESEEKFRTIAENSSLGISIIKNGKIIYVNEALSELGGYSIEEMKQWKKNQFVLQIHPDDLPLVWNEIQKRQRSKQKIPLQYTFRTRTKSGKLIWIEVFSKTILYQGDYADLTIMIDVTEKKEAEESLKESERKLREQNIELQKLDQLKTNFLTMVSHELKTPLISIGGYTDLILTKYPNLDAEIIDDLSRVKNNVNRLGTYIEQLMDVLKIDAKKMDFDLKFTNLKDIIINCINELDYLINKKNLNVELHIDNEISLEIDADRISQVFTNLISNAIKFTPEQGKVEISAKKMEEEGNYLFKVKDSGVGINQDQIEHLFEKFVMLEKGTESTSAFETGSGLGLYITKGIIEGHGGKIWAKSNGKGTGAEFYFTLPSLYHPTKLKF
ncbi:MAG: PAS domain S-box protein [Promethearchaeota archaeon]|nr:MAG: PAS domain S-box protein [Candidatus Lokiarchaeota archaeon]